MKLKTLIYFIAIFSSIYAAAAEEWVTILTEADASESEHPEELALERCNNALLNFAQSCNRAGSKLKVAEEGCQIIEVEEFTAMAGVKVQCN